MGKSGDSANVSFNVKSNTLAGYPTGIRVVEITDAALQTNYNTAVLMKDDDKKYIREWLNQNTVVSVNMDIWRVSNALQFLYTTASDDYCHALCPAESLPTDILDYCIVNPLEPTPVSFVYNSLTTALNECRQKADGTREVRLAGGDYSLVYDFANIGYKIRPQGVRASNITVVVPEEREIYNDQTVVKLSSALLRLNNATVLLENLRVTSPRFSKVVSTKESTVRITNSILSTASINAVNNIDLRQNEITGLLDMTEYDSIIMEANRLRGNQFDIKPLKNRAYRWQQILKLWKCRETLRELDYRRSLQRSDILGQHDNKHKVNKVTNDQLQVQQDPTRMHILDVVSQQYRQPL